MEKQKIELGNKVKDKYTGFIGIAVARVEFINGCIQYSVVPKWDGKAPIIEDISIDSQSLEVVKPKRKPRKKAEERTGGPTIRGFKQRGF